MEVTDNIRRVIEQKGMVQRIVAERAGFNKHQFCDMLNGRKTLKAQYMPQIAAALGVTVAELYGEKTTADYEAPTAV